MKHIKYAYRRRVAAYIKTETAQHTHSFRTFPFPAYIFTFRTLNKTIMFKNFIAQQNKFASAPDNTTKPTDSGRFIYMLNKLKA
jgi:hypothetical protein